MTLNEARPAVDEIMRCVALIHWGNLQRKLETDLRRKTQTDTVTGDIATKNGTVYLTLITQIYENMSSFTKMDVALIAEVDKQNNNSKLTRMPITKISLSETDPDDAVQILNAVVDRLVESN